MRKVTLAGVTAFCKRRLGQLQDLLKRKDRVITVRLVTELSPKQRDWRNDPAIRAWTRQNGLITKAEQEAWLDAVGMDRGVRMFGIEAQDGTGRAENVGTCGLTSCNWEHGHAEFSLFIGPEHHKKGYGRLALIELLRYGFNVLRLEYIWGETMEGNWALKMFKSIGMKESGRHRLKYFKNGKRIDSIDVEMLAKDFRGLHG